MEEEEGEQIDALQSARKVQSPTTESTNNTTTTSAAMLEVDAVLESLIGGESHLDGFNLLGVIANPRGVPLTSSFHGRYNNNNNTASSPSAAASSASQAPHTDGSMFSATYYSIESTLSQATNQMEYMNSILEDWSRQILDEPYSYYYAQDETQPESLLQELPVELQNIQLHSLKHHLATSGNAAASFRNRMARNQVLDHSNNQHQRSSLMLLASSSGDFDTTTTAAVAAQHDIPPIFFRTDFDLTEPEIFRELLLIGGEENDEFLTVAAASLGNTSSRADDAEDDSEQPTFDPDDGSVHDWFLLQPPEAFTLFLDKVELALLHQVQSKSGVFFEESLRFAQLQEGIQASMEHVLQLRATTSHLQQDLMDPMELVPIADEQRVDLQRLSLVLDQANQLVKCKSSIAGYLSAQDDSTAIEQIQYGRKLLTGQADDSDNDDNDELVELRRLHAFKTVTDQLGQFEQLVTTNLRDELVEMFLDWHSSSNTSIYAIHNGSSPAKSTSQPVQERVREIVESLTKCNGLPQMLETYSTRLQDVIRMTVRTTVSEFAQDSEESSVTSTSVAVTSMSLERFLDCLDMLFESIVSLLNACRGVNEFCMAQGFNFTTRADDSAQDEGNKETKHNDRIEAGGPMADVLYAAAELSTKSISELVRYRKEAHSLVTLEEMKRIWDKCIGFVSQTEALGGHTASNLRSTLLAQAKAFVERKHESNTSALVAALDSERWTQWEVKVERQAAISRLCHGRSLVIASESEGGDDGGEKTPQVEVEGTQYKVVWSCLLVVEMIINDITAATHFPTLTANVVAKVAELLRLFNSRSTHLVLGAGAIQSAARLKSINAKHLSMVTQCLGLMIALMPHIRSALMQNLPTKQQMLLTSLDQIKKDYSDHNEKVLNKFVTIIGGIIEHGLAPKIVGTDFDARAKSSVSSDENAISCCIFLEGVSSNARKMHQVLASLLPPDHLQDVFSRIFAFVDQKIPALVISASEQREGAKKDGPPSALFRFPTTDDGKKRLLQEVEAMTENLNALPGVYPWDFTIVSVLGKHMMYELYPNDPSTALNSNDAPSNGDMPETPNVPNNFEQVVYSKENGEEEKAGGYHSEVEHLNEDNRVPVDAEKVEHHANGEVSLDDAFDSPAE